MSTVLFDPTGELEPTARAPAARLSELSGRTVGLLDISKPKGNLFLDRLEEHLQSQGAKVLRFRKPTFARNAPADLRKEILERCDAVIEALAD